VALSLEESMLSVGEKRCLDGENIIFVFGGKAGGTSPVLDSNSFFNQKKSKLIIDIKTIDKIVFFYLTKKKQYC
jgi:hypothetical protein